MKPTIAWAKQHVNTHVQGVRAAAHEIGAVIRKAKEVDGGVEEDAMKRALRGESRAMWSAAMGTYQSTFGDVHHSPSKDELLKTLGRRTKNVIKADADKNKRYSVAELRTLKNRGEMHLVQYAKARRAE
jgi:hypothetical protein